MRIQNYSIRDVMKGIEGGKMTLPAWHREFVWKRKDIERLFDSLMLGFPINTLMFWQVDDTKNAYRWRKKKGYVREVLEKE